MSALALGMAGALGAVSFAGGSGFAGAGSGSGLAGGGGLEGAGRVLDFRRRGAPPRRRRRNPLLALARPLGVAVAAVALPLALAAWVLTSPRFQLRHVEVVAAAPAAPAVVAPRKSRATLASPVSLAIAAPAAPAAAADRPGRAASASPASPVAATPSGAAGAMLATPPAHPAGRVPAAWVQQALTPFLGRNLLRLQLAEVRQRLAVNPWIAAVDVAKQLPDRLRVSIAERRPAVLLRRGQALLYADAAGRPIAPVESPAEAAVARRQELLVVTLPALLAGASAPGPQSRNDGAAAAATVWEAEGEEERGVAGALLLAARLRQLRPAWTRALSQIDVVDEDDYQLHAPGLPCPLLVRGSHLAGNLERFEELLPELRRRYPALASVDLRFTRRVVVQLAATPAVQPPATPAVQPATTPAVQRAPAPARAAAGGPKDETAHQTPGKP
jgi:cell division septal protein FtsQ